MKLDIITIPVAYTKDNIGYSSDMVEDMIKGGADEDDFISWGELKVNVNQIVSYNAHSNGNRITLRLTGDVAWDVKLTINEFEKLI